MGVADVAVTVNELNAGASTGAAATCNNETNKDHEDDISSTNTSSIGIATYSNCTAFT